MKDLKVMVGSTPAPSKMHITVTDKGPYLVYGAPSLFQEFIVSDESGECKRYEKGAQFTLSQEPTALCRCGESRNHPYCDSSHLSASWSPKLTADRKSLLSDADIIEGGDLTLVDNQKYCVYARFCHPQGGTWRLTEESDNPDARAEAIRQASACPSARLTAWGIDKSEPYEPDLEPSLSLLEDPSIGISAGLWIKGGIVMRSQDGEPFEVRNRVVACRCGASTNKPFCDGSHAQKQWHDGLETPLAEELVEA